MSGLDLSAAIEAADEEIASYDARVGGELLYGPESDMPEYVVRKVAPLIEAQVREQVAAEIEAEAARHVRRGFSDGLRYAVRIVWGQS